MGRGHYKASKNGFSAVYGPLIRGFEVMEPSGEVRQRLAFDEVFKLVNLME